MFLFANSAAGKEPPNNSTTVLPMFAPRLYHISTFYYVYLTDSFLGRSLRMTRTYSPILVLLFFLCDFFFLNFFPFFLRGNQRLCALQTVQQFSIRLSELQCDLRRDKDTLAVLDVALQAGATSEVASSVRHVARLLSEKQEVHSQVSRFFLLESI